MKSQENNDEKQQLIYIDLYWATRARYLWFFFFVSS